MTSSLPLSITEAAIREAQHIYTSKGIPISYGLRIGAKSSGCASLNHYLGFDEKQENDLEYKIGDLSILISKKDVMYLIGITLDFVDTNETRGFAFI